MVLEVDERLNDMLHVEAGFLQDLADFVEAVLDLIREFVVGTIIPLACNVEGLSDHDSGRKHSPRSPSVLGDKPLGRDLARAQFHEAQSNCNRRDDEKTGFHHGFHPPERG